MACSKLSGRHMTVHTGPARNDESQALDRPAVDGEPLDEWAATVMRNMKRMATDEAYRRSITKHLS